MQIAPNATAIDIEARVPNEDSGFVSVGQKAAAKVALVPFTPILFRVKVIRTGKDSLDILPKQSLPKSPA